MVEGGWGMLREIGWVVGAGAVSVFLKVSFIFYVGLVLVSFVVVDSLGVWDLVFRLFLWYYVGDFVFGF